LVLARTPYKFNGLTVLGDIVFILDLVLFLGLCAEISTRFILFPKAFMDSLRHPTESLFFPTFWISIVNILDNIQEYGVPNAALGWWSQCVFFSGYTLLVHSLWQWGNTSSSSPASRSPSKISHQHGFCLSFRLCLQERLPR
jgi:tellurite resistance protein TehA-like permease